VTGAARHLAWTEEPVLRGYLGFVARQLPLTNAQECALARQIRDGDREAVDKLVNANLRFVIRLVGRFRNRGLDDLDLIAEGTVGLIMAVRRSGWRGECRLVVVAVWWILDAVRGAIDEKVGPGAVLLLPGTPQVPSGQW
jgi:RNA polymerase primary sigma factor